MLRTISQAKMSVCGCFPVCVRIPEVFVPVSAAVRYAGKCDVTSHDTLTGLLGNIPGFEYRRVIYEDELYHISLTYFGESSYFSEFSLYTFVAYVVLICGLFFCLFANRLCFLAFFEPHVERLCSLESSSSCFLN